MEDRDVVSLSSIPPLHKGRTFACYRDVNKAIERHRELYGLRLALKRAVKLENYCLTREQMKDLNLRLKYGELDYHCFAATGRPGRPGNDERCPQLIRLKLNADAQSLIVYESHNHNILPFSEASLQNQPPIKQKMDFFTSLPHDRTYFKGDITLTPINPVQKNPVLILPKPASGGEVQSPAPQPLLAKNFFINNNSFGTLTPVHEINSITITPTPSVRIYPQPGENNSLTEAENHEKITMRIKKSQVVPNEMVVVGSLRDTEEQRKSKGHEGVSSSIVKQQDSQPPQPTANLPKESLPQNAKILKDGSSPIVPSPTVPSTGVPSKLATSSVPKPGNLSPKVVSNNMKNFSQNPIPKIKSTGKSPITTVKPPGTNKPGMNLAQKSSPSGNPTFKSPFSQLQKEAQKLKAKPISPATSTYPTANAAITTAPTSTPTTTTPTVLKQSSNMKQIIIKKPLQGGDIKPKPVAPGRPPNVTGKASPNVTGRASPNVSGKAPFNPVGAGFNKSQNDANRASPLGTNKPSPPVGNASKPIYKPAANTVKPWANRTNDGNTTEKKIGPKPLPIQNPKVSNSKSGLQQNPVRTIPNGSSLSDRIKPRIGNKNISHTSVKPLRNAESSVVNGNMNGGTRISNVPKKLKRKPGRPPDSYSSATSLMGPLDTELAYLDKQNLAHGVVLQLLKVTCDLPMVEFTHALDTLEVVAEAFRLGQKVSLVIRHDEDDLLNGEDRADTLIDRHLKENSVVTSTTTVDDNRGLMDVQIDGQFDADELLKRLWSTCDSVIPPERREEERPVERMDVDVNVVDVDERRRGRKRVSTEPFISSVDTAKRIKR